VSKWLGHSHLAEEGKVTHWKTQYRLRHNWSKGVCRVSKVEVAQLSQPPILTKLHSGVVFTANKENGLRAWSTKHPKTPLAYISFANIGDTPTALSTTQESTSSLIEVTVGLENGRYDLYDFDVTRAEFSLRCSHTTSPAASITAIASSPPYLLTVTHHKVLSLYKVQPSASPTDPGSGTLHMLVSLEANNLLAPMSLSIRHSASEIIASIAYSFFHISCGWSIGIQELRFNQHGEHLGSQLATTITSQHGENNMPMMADMDNATKRNSGVIHNPLLTSFLSNPSIHHNDPPTSLSYSHPYLLTSHRDNTLTMYLVVSSSDKLWIKGARRLWGHTSSVANVQVSDRGKAVSVSPRGNEIRIWELEKVIASPSPSRTPSKGESSVRLSPEKPARENNHNSHTTLGAVNWGRQRLRRESEDVPAEVVDMHGWVGFDEEQVVVLREMGRGTQLLECYDFT
jgi:hypothetical protein